MLGHVPGGNLHRSSDVTPFLKCIYVMVERTGDPFTLHKNF